MPNTIRSLTDAAADAVGREIATLRREARQERELRDAEHRAKLAELETRLLSAADLERRLTDRLAGLKDGDPGAPGEIGPEGQPGEPGERGAPGSPGEVGPMGERGFGLDDFDTEVIEDGKTLLLKFVRGEVTEQHEIPLPVGPQGPQGEAGLSGEPGERGFDGERGAPGEPGERGPEGPPGKLPIVRAWSEGVHYEGDVRQHAGSTYQAARDTGREPPSEDWQLIAAAGERGADGVSFESRGTWSPDVEYRAFNVVALNGGSFVAKHDDPGICPGEGWQLLASQGKRGAPGERGPAGERGAPGEAVVAMHIEGDAILTLTNGDGSTVTCDLYPLLSQLDR